MKTILVFTLSLFVAACSSDQKSEADGFELQEERQMQEEEKQMEEEEMSRTGEADLWDSSSYPYSQNN